MAGKRLSGIFFVLSVLLNQAYLLVLGLAQVLLSWFSMTPSYENMNPFLRLFYLKLLTRTSIESETKNFRTGVAFEVCFLHFSATLFLCALFLVSFERIFNLKSNDMSSVFNGGHLMEYEVFRRHTARQ